MPRGPPSVARRLFPSGAALWRNCGSANVPSGPAKSRGYRPRRRISRDCWGIRELPTAPPSSASNTGPSCAPIRLFGSNKPALRCSACLSEASLASGAAEHYMQPARSRSAKLIGRYPAFGSRSAARKAGYQAGGACERRSEPLILARRFTATWPQPLTKAKSSRCSLRLVAVYPGRPISPEWSW